jgi:hypothetical protein
LPVGTTGTTTELLFEEKAGDSGWYRYSDSLNKDKQLPLPKYRYSKVDRVFENGISPIHWAELFFASVFAGKLQQRDRCNFLVKKIAWKAKVSVAVNISYLAFEERWIFIISWPIKPVLKCRKMPILSGTCSKINESCDRRTVLFCIRTQQNCNKTDNLYGTGLRHL